MCSHILFHHNNAARAQEQAVDYADFLVTSDRTNITNTAEHFVARIVDPIMIAEARAELDKSEGFKIISGTIEKTPVDWNPGWSYHFIPETIFFGDFFIIWPRACPIFFGGVGRAKRFPVAAWMHAYYSYMQLAAW